MYLYFVTHDVALFILSQEFMHSSFWWQMIFKILYWKESFYFSKESKPMTNNFKTEMNGPEDNLSINQPERKVDY